jgi:hypothetical protein
LFRRLIVSIGFALLLVASPLQAAVTLTFYSKELSDSFPHAFVDLSGTIDADRTPVAATFGFTAKHLSPAILMGNVQGVVEPVTDGYKRSSNAHFSIRLTDDQYRAVLATVEKWRTLPGKSYNLNRRNCVFFVGDIARTVGLTVVDDPKLMKKPRSFTQSIAALNPWVSQGNPAIAPVIATATAAAPR